MAAEEQTTIDAPRQCRHRGSQLPLGDERWCVACGAISTPFGWISPGEQGRKLLTFLGKQRAPEADGE